MKTIIPSLIKWSGSKRLQANKLISLIPNHERYFEPFLGGGALMYLIKSNHIFASDIYKPLIDLWLVVKNDHKHLIDDYQKRWEELQIELKEIRANEKIYLKKSRQNFPKTFYSARSEFNKSKNPLAFNFILRTCVNGIVRFNSKGEFNNSFHLSRNGMNPAIFKKVVEKWSLKLKSVDINCADYTFVLDNARSGDFIYLDPPYLGCNNRYVKPINAKEFFDFLEDLNRKRVYWMCSLDGFSNNKNYENYSLPRELYKKSILIKNGRSFTSGVLNNKEGEVFESLYTNYQTPIIDELTQLDLKIAS